MQIDRESDVIRQFLLGSIFGPERDRLEERFMTDRDYQEEVLIVEEELIQNYLTDGLSSEDKARFITHWLSTPQQMERLEVAQALHRYCSKPEDAETQSSTTEMADNAWSQLRNIGLRFKSRRVTYALAAGLSIVVVGLAWTLFGRWQGRGVAEQDFGDTLVRLNAQSGDNRTPDLTVTVPPIMTRGGESPIIPSLGESKIVQLFLTLPPDDHHTYRVTLRSDHTAKQYTLSDLDATATKTGRAVSVKVPSSFLTPGLYNLEVSGPTSDRKFEGVADYGFQVSK